MRPLTFERDLSQLIDQAKPSLLFAGSTPDEFADWQRRFRDRLVALLGRVPERAAPDLQFSVEVDCGTYVRHRVQYQTEPSVWVPAYLLVPKDATVTRPVPAILCLHGHSDFGKDSVAGLRHTPERTREVERSRYDFGHRFATAGYVVLAPDLRGFGERQADYPASRIDHSAYYCDLPGRCNRNYLAATLLGTTVVALQLCDLAAALDVLGLLPYVDGTMLACAGLSLGGRMTMLISALDHRIKLCVPSGCLNLYQERYQALRQCGSQLIPGVLRYGDTPEIFSLIAPRPVVIEWGLHDPLIPHEWAERGLARIRRAYEAAGVPHALIVHRFAGGHVFDGTVAREVLARWREHDL